jgi:hypothetical protein
MALIKSKREQNLLIVTLLVVALGLGYVGYLRYEEEWGKLRQDLTDLQDDYQVSVRILINLKDIMNRYQRITEDLRLEGGESIWQIRIREEIDGFLAKAGIERRGSTNPEDPVYHDDVGAMEYRFRIDDLVTTMPDLARFLSLLEEESAVLEVKELNVRPTDRRRGGNYGVRVTMHISRIVFTDVRTDEEPEKA